MLNFQSIIISTLYYVLWLCDYSFFIPNMIFIAYYLSTLDIIHSFGISSLGIRVDCVSGRVNVVFELIKLNGKLKGLCYELCGQFHSNMVILGYVIVFKLGQWTLQLIPMVSSLSCFIMVVLICFDWVNFAIASQMVKLVKSKKII